MVRVPNYPDMLPQRPRSVSFFSTNTHSSRSNHVLTSFGAFTLRIVGSVEPISMSSCSGGIKSQAITIDEIVHEPQSESRCCGIPWENEARGVCIILNASTWRSIASWTGGLPGSMVMTMPSRSLARIKKEYSSETTEVGLPLVPI